MTISPSYNKRVQMSTTC